MARTGLLLNFMVLLMFTGCSRDSQIALQPGEKTAKRIASTEVVNAVPAPVEIEAGSSSEMVVRLTIQSGYHVNANPPTFSYLIPTELAITPSAGVSAGTVSYPAPKTAKFSFSENPLAVYEGNVEIKVTLKADKSATPGQHSLAAELRVQACDDQVCYPPGTRELTIPVTIKPVFIK